MPISDIYTGSGTVAVASTSATPIASLVTGASVRAFVVGIRVGIGAATVAGNVLFQLARISNPTSVTNGTTGGTAPNDPNAPTSTETFLYAGGTAYGVAPTISTSILWQQELPTTAGSSWEEFPPLGYEYTVNVSSGVGIWVTCTTATSTPYTVEIIWSH